MASSPSTNAFLNIIFILFIIIIVISLIICLFVFIGKRGTLGSISIKNGSLIGAIFLFIIIILFLIVIPITIKNNVVDNFANMTPNIQIQTGRSGISQSGSIDFPVSFVNKPKVFTQIIGNNENTNSSTTEDDDTNTNTTGNVYSVQIFNVTTNGFNYSKNKVINNKSGNFTISSLEKASVEPFDWIAIG